MLTHEEEAQLQLHVHMHMHTCVHMRMATHEEEAQLACSSPRRFGKQPKRDTLRRGARSDRARPAAAARRVAAVEQQLAGTSCVDAVAVVRRGQS